MPRVRSPRDRVLTANGLRLAYRDWGGDGPVLLALHGSAAHLHWWDPVAPYLARQLRVLALDWRGHGRSAWPRPPAYRTEDFAADLLVVLDRLGLPSVAVAAHSMGGQIALAFAAWHPERVFRLVVLDTRPAVNLDRLRAIQRRPPRAQTEFPSRAEALARFRLRPPETIAAPAVLRELAAAGVHRLASGRWAYRFDLECERTRVPVDGWPLLPRITAPTLILRGEHSTLLTREVAQQMAQAIPTARAEDVAGAHHHVTLDAPEAVAQAILDWVP